MDSEVVGRFQQMPTSEKPRVRPAWGNPDVLSFLPLPHASFRPNNSLTTTSMSSASPEASKTSADLPKAKRVCLFLLNLTATSPSSNARSAVPVHHPPCRATRRYPSTPLTRLPLDTGRDEADPLLLVRQSVLQPRTSVACQTCRKKRAKCDGELSSLPQSSLSNADLFPSSTLFSTRQQTDMFPLHQSRYYLRGRDECGQEETVYEIGCPGYAGSDRPPGNATTNSDRRNWRNRRRRISFPASKRCGSALERWRRQCVCGGAIAVRRRRNIGSERRFGSAVVGRTGGAGWRVRHFPRRTRGQRSRRASFLRTFFPPLPSHP
jgi:hypothetical protein